MDTEASGRLIRADRITKEYATAAGPLRVLADATLHLDRGEAAAITGPSGSGKSTVLYLLGALDRPDEGTVLIDGTNVGTLDDAASAAFRNRHIGFVFQDHALLPHCTAIENVLVPALVHSNGAAQRQERARMLLKAVGLEGRADHKPGQLSGGERQRVAIARALVMEPSVLLCDEPTGNLDQATAASVADLLLRLQSETEATLVLVTHSPELAARLPKRYQLTDKRLVRA